MNQYKKVIVLWVLLFAICGSLFGCINLEINPVVTTVSDTTAATPADTDSVTPEETTPDVTQPQETTSENTPNDETTTEPLPDEDTTPEETTTESIPQETTTEPLPEEDTTPEETTSEPLPQETTTDESTTDEPDDPTEPVEKIKIYIDQGHNPFSPTHPPSWNTGASNEALGLYEQDITFDFGIRLAALLEQDGRFEVRLSRPTADTILGTDNDSALDYRVNDAAEWGADYFISLHTNSFSTSSAHGLEVYTAKDDEEGYAIGNEILNALVETTNLRNRGMKDGSHLRVLKNAQMPAALIEMGFISNENDAILLRDSSELFIQGLYNGILSYFNTLE